MRNADSSPRGEPPSKVLLASSTWWPLSAKLAVAFLRNGCRAEVLCVRDHPFRFVSGISRIHTYRGLNSLQSLYEAIVSSDPGMVVPCDDSVVWQLHELRRTREELRPLIDRSLGAPSSHSVVDGRAELIQVAQELRIRAPHTIPVTTAAHLEEWFSVPGTSGVLKADRTCAGKAVHIVHSFAEAEHAMDKIRRPISLTVAFARWLLIHDAAALWNWRNNGRPKLSLQQFIPGIPANAMLACRDGEVLAIVMVEVLCAQGRTGPSLVVRLIENNEMRIAAERLARRLHLSGFYGLDFILEEATGDAYLVELNPRCTQLGHLQIAGQGNLAGALCGVFADATSRPTQEPIRQEIVAFFPQVLLSETECPHLEAAYIDIPWDEPYLVREMMRRDWRDRSLLARAYNALRSPHRPVVMFDDANVAEARRHKTPVTSGSC